METATFPAYITKFALTTGIIRLEVRVCSDTSPDMVEYQGTPGSLGEYYHGEGSDWHRTWESALARAESMRQAKIKALRKQLAKIEAMEFKKPEE